MTYSASKMPIMLRLGTTLVLLLALFITGCQSDLSIAEDRDQAQAVQIVSLLNSQGIAAYAVKNRTGGRFSVSVPSRFYHQSMALINEYELAGDARPSIQELVQSHSILPGSRDAERFRLDLALALQLEDTLENIDGILSAQVIVRKHVVKDTADAGASITLLLRKGSSISSETILGLIRAALPEVKKNNVIVQQSFFEPELKHGAVAGAVRKGDAVYTVPLRKFLYWQVPEGDHSGLAIAFLAAISITALVFIGIGYVFGYVRSVRSVVTDTAPTENDMLSFSGERPGKNLPEV